jgi:diguanylate cyclase (GGDEF)-like protein/PAS domain S-box-containing protein
MNPKDANKLLLGYGHEILLLVDLATQQIRAANEAAARHLGYTWDELIGRPVTDIVCVPTDIFYWNNVRQGIVADIHYVETSYLCAGGELLEVSRTIIHPASHPDSLVVCAIPIGKLRHAETEAATDGRLLLDKKGAIVDMNRQFARIWGISDESLRAGEHHAIFEFMASRMDDPAAYKRRLAEIRPDGDDETYDLLTLGDGRFIERRSRPAKQGEAVIGRVFSFTGISRRQARESRLALAASAFAQAHEGIMISDAGNNIVDVNAAFCHITGYAREEVIGRNPRFLKSGRQGGEFYQAMWSELTACGHWEGEVWNQQKDGRLYAERISITAVRDEAIGSLHYLAILSDITELKGYQQQIERMTHYDMLTGVPNRVLLFDRLNLAIAQARRYSRHLALVYLDIDEFKAVNDAHDHETGDQLLVTLALRLRDSLREGDTLARLGGDEFAAVITDMDSQTECEPFLNRLLKTAARPIDLKQTTFRLSASLGFTLFPQDDGDADTLLRHAIQAMYQAKQTGKNRYQQFDLEKERQTQIHHRSLDRIAQAITQNEFELFFQPKVNMRTGVVVGAEALIRWRHPEHGLLPPGKFLPSIEESDLMIRLDDWVLNAALRQMTAWSGQGLDLAVSVNVSARHLQQADFLPKLKKELAAYPAVRPHRLELEVLETTALEGIAQVSSLIEGCQAIGVLFSLDDFGTGYSSLTYLRRLPADVLKIDQSFVRDMLSNSGDKAIIEGIIGLAAAFGRTVIAEGVETAEHGELLLRLGCELAQGYGIARPMPASELPAWIAAWRPPAMWSSAYDVAI